MKHIYKRGDAVVFKWRGFSYVGKYVSRQRDTSIWAHYQHEIAFPSVMATGGSSIRQEGFMVRDKDIKPFNVKRTVKTPKISKRIRFIWP